eukprot:887067-Prorocentrum_minimum.AAC.2
MPDGRAEGGGAARDQRVHPRAVRDQLRNGGGFRRGSGGGLWCRAGGISGCGNVRAAISCARGGFVEGVGRGSVVRTALEGVCKEIGSETNFPVAERLNKGLMS